jgi:hypothetical protein
VFQPEAKNDGRLVAAALAGAWRRTPSALDLTDDELSRVASLLMRSGAAALLWWRLRQSVLRTTPAAEGLRQAYRLQTLKAALHEQQVEEVFLLLQSAGIDAVLIKGWSVARMYPEQGLRGVGDIDLCVRTEQHGAARAVLENPGGRRFWVDLHEGFGRFDPLGADKLYARTQIFRVGRANVRVLGREDQLHLLCVHFLRHGAWRPLWLCDVAALVEVRHREFDWDRVLCRGRRSVNWVACTLGLAQRLLGARIDDTPFAGAALRLPRWLVHEVLKQWETPFATSQAPIRYRAPMSAHLRRPRGALRDLINRWPNPIAATVHMGGAFDEMPRLPFQLGECVVRTARFLSRLAKSMREQQ